MLPDCLELRQALETLVVSQSSSGLLPAGAVVAAPRVRRQFADGRIDESADALMITQRRFGLMTPIRVCERIADSLDGSGHVHCQRSCPSRVAIAASVAAMALLSRHRREDILPEINRYIAAVRPARLAIWSVIAALATNRDLDQFGDFCYGVIDTDELRRACEHAGSDYADLWGTALRGRRCLKRSGRTPQIIDFAKIERPFEVGRHIENHLYRLTDEYYASIAEQERRLFLIDLDRQQATYGTAGLGTIPSEMLMRLEATTHWVAVFNREDARNGWVVPNQAFFKLTMTEPRAYMAGRKAITDELGLQDWGQRPLDRYLQPFCEYFTGAQALALHGRLEEAMLHFVFGLDLLLGGEATEALTAVLAERVAIVSHKAVGKTVEHVDRFIRESYTMRSGYAHRGTRGTLADSHGHASLEDRVTELERVGRAVFGVGCIARREPWAQDKGCREAWLKRIDYLRAKRGVDTQLDTADYASLGLHRVSVVAGRLPTLMLVPE